MPSDPTPETEPRAAQLAKEVSALPDEIRTTILDAWEALLRTGENIAFQAEVYERIARMEEEEEERWN